MTEQRLLPRQKTTRTEQAKDGSAEQVECSNIRVALELTASVTKSVSVLATIGRDARLVRVASFIAERLIFDLARLAATRCRREGADCNRTTGSLYVIPFLHLIGRDGDPQLHVHLVVLNLTWDPVEKRFKALQWEPMLRQLAPLTARWHGHWNDALRQFGYTVDCRGGEPTVPLPKRLLKAFSKRKSNSRARGQAQGTSDPAPKKTAQPGPSACKRPVSQPPNRAGSLASGSGRRSC